MSKKINELHQWSYLPSLIWLDMYTLVAKDDLFMHHLAFTLANFRRYIQTLVARKKRKKIRSSSASASHLSMLPSSSSEDEKTICLLALNRNCPVVGRKLFIVKNLGYYKPKQIHYKFENVREYLRSKSLYT